MSIAAVPQLPDHPEPERWTADQFDMELPQLGFVITRLDQMLQDADEGAWPLDMLAHALKDMRENAGYLRDVLASLERLVGDRMTKFQQTIEGVGTLERHANKSMTQWDKDALLAAVLDTVMIDPKTGEIIAETPLEKVLATFNLPAPRTTVLKARGLQADEFCQVTDNGGFKVAIR